MVRGNEAIDRLVVLEVVCRAFIGREQREIGLEEVEEGMLPANACDTVIVKQVDGEPVVSSGKAFPDQLPSMLCVRDRNKDVANARVMLAHLRPLLESADDGSHGRADAVEGPPAMALNRERGRSSHAVDDQPPPQDAYIPIGVREFDGNAAGTDLDVAAGLPIQDRAPGLLELLPSPPQELAGIQADVEDALHPQFGGKHTDLSRMEAHNSPGMPVRDDLLDLLGGEEFRLYERLELAVGDIPLAVGLAGYATVEERHAVAVALAHHERMQQAEPTAGVDQVPGFVAGR